MRSNANALGGHDSARRRDGSSSASPRQTRTTSSVFSAGSGDTGESSVSAGQRNSQTSGLTDGADDVEPPMKDGRTHRSHRSRASGGFLLSNAAFEQPMEHLTPAMEVQLQQGHDMTRKSPLRNPEKKNGKKHSYLGSHTSSTLLNGSSSSTGMRNGMTMKDKPDINNVEGRDHDVDQPAPAGLDVDSAQIVNLALNLSESRRNASRRIVSLPPVSSGIGESFVGGSLRQHLQQQRRIPRTVSPKPDRGDWAMTASPRITSAQRISSPLQAAFESPVDTRYQYHFSKSTLARAEKARNAIELMAEYRRLLEYMPPLKSQLLERATTAASGSDTSNSISLTKSGQSSSVSTRPQGREYNPLQYIRNRKLRARSSRAIDGDVQGFGDIDKVSSWVDNVAQLASSEAFQSADYLVMPPFSAEAEQGATSPQTSPQTNQSKTQNAVVKAKRPRVDWIFTPADLLADIFWLEQDDNKKLIEDRNGQRIFPRDAELRRPISRRSAEPELRHSSNPLVNKEDVDTDLRIDTKLPEFRSVRPEQERSSDSATSRARRKLRDVRDATRIHGHSGSARDSRLFLRSRSRSSSSSSDSDSMRHSRRRRSDTADSHDRGKVILEKQMMELVAKETLESERRLSRNIEGPEFVDSSELSKATPKTSLERSRNERAAHSRSTSLIDNQKQSSSGRPSLEVPGANSRRSLEEFYSSAPNSPQTRAKRLSNAFIPSIGMDLSPTRSRRDSPTRRGLSKVRSKILPRYERTHGLLPSTSQATSDEQALEDSEDQKTRQRSLSPVKKSSEESQRPTKSGSVKKARTEDVSGIRGLFKNSRNPVSKVGDLLRKKEITSGFSTDESDAEDLRTSRSKEQKTSRESSTGLQPDDITDFSSGHHVPSYIKDMPVFTSPFEKRGRTALAKADEDLQNRIMSGRAERRSIGAILYSAPRIDVQDASPASSPERALADRLRRDSSISDDSRRDSTLVHDADARLNAILGLPGKRRNALPMTGLANLEANHEGRPSLDGKRQWSISDRAVSTHRGPMNKREIARVRALLLSSGIKAKEIQRRAAELVDLSSDDDSTYADISSLARNPIVKVPRSQEHKLAARVLSDDVQLSARMWQSSADTFCHTTVSGLVDQIGTLQSCLANNLTPMTRNAADEADAVSRDLVTNQTLQIKSVTDKIDKMMRTRRRKFRWLRRGGWVMLEWALVGIMWWVWFIVVLFRVVLGIGSGVISGLRWLFWL